MNIQNLKKLSLPDTPGVYFFKQKGKILYIGKATSLRDRVRSYFASDVIKTRGSHIVDMVFKSDTVSVEQTGSVLEALVLEAALIKKYKPYYNTKEKDDKSFYSVVVTKEPMPRVLLVRQKDIDVKNKRVTTQKKFGGVVLVDSFYGPFTSSEAIKEGLRLLRRIFPFIDAASSKKDQRVFYRQIGLSPDVSDQEALVAYKKRIRYIKLFLSGKFSDLRKSLEREMVQLAKRELFEDADEVKKKLFALGHIRDVSLLKRRNEERESHPLQNRIEAYDVAHISGKHMVGVMTVVSFGRAEKNAYRKFIIRSASGSNDPLALSEILTRRLNHPEWGIPSVIIVDGNQVQKKVAEKILAEHKLSVPVIAVVKDERHKPRALLGSKAIIEGLRYEILLANNEAHRFAIAFHREKRGRL